MVTSIVPIWIGSMVGATIAIVVSTMVFTVDRRRRWARAIRARLYGPDGETMVRSSSGLPTLVGGALTTNVQDARQVIAHVRAPSDRIVVTYDDWSVTLDADGTRLAIALLAAGARRARRLRRLLSHRRVQYWIRGGGPGFSNISDQDRVAVELAYAWLETRSTVRMSVGGARVELNRRGGRVLAGLLVAPHSMVHRAEVVLGAQDGIGWADWLPSYRVVRDVLHDRYLDSPPDPWVFNRTPIHGDRDERKRR